MRGKFLNSIELKILSVVVALVLWIMVRGEQRADIYISVKVEAKNMPRTLIVTSQSSDRINIRLKGPKNLLAKMNRKYFRPYLCDMSGALPGKVECEIVSASFNIENGVKITETSPTSVFFEIDTVDKKIVGVEPDFHDSLDEGYELEEYKVYPDRVTVEGPANFLKELKSVKTAPISLKERRRSFVVKLPVAVSGPGLTMDGNVNEVLVNIRIRESRITKIIRDVPITMELTSPLWALSDSYVDVKIVGPAGKVNDISKEEIFVIADKDQDAIAAAKGNKLAADLAVREIPDVELSVVEVVYLIKKE